MRLAILGLLLVGCVAGTVKLGADSAQLVANDTSTSGDSATLDDSSAHTGDSDDSGDSTGPDSDDTGPDTDAHTGGDDTGDTNVGDDTDGHESGEDSTSADDTSDPGCTPGLSMYATTATISTSTTAWPAITGCEATGITAAYPTWLSDPLLPEALHGDAYVRLKAVSGTTAPRSGVMTITSDQNELSITVTLE